MPKRRSSLFVLALALMAAVAPTVSAQDLPGGPARIYVPFAPGGPTDVLARILADLLSTRWGGMTVCIHLTRCTLLKNVCATVPIPGCLSIGAGALIAAKPTR
jgi:hypothetical protein